VIVDASVAFKWIVDEALSDEAEALLVRNDLIAPSIVFAEVGHAISKRIRRGEFATDGVVERFERLPTLLATVKSDEDLHEAMKIAIRLHHSFYDCLYLALAERLDDVLITADAVYATKLAKHGFGERVELLGAAQ
jgi:predicted nucleic acid-binding protein